jgi:hypothetical protein
LGWEEDGYPSQTFVLHFTIVGQIKHSNNAIYQFKAEHFPRSAHIKKSLKIISQECLKPTRTIPDSP